jgi:hypothetical protein
LAGVFFCSVHCFISAEIQGGRDFRPSTDPFSIWTRGAAKLADQLARWRRINFVPTSSAAQQTNKAGARQQLAKAFAEMNHANRLERYLRSVR